MGLFVRFNQLDSLPVLAVFFGLLIPNLDLIEQLDLQLSFLDFNNGRKVMVTLDMACLNRGVYPSDILPYQLQAFVAGAYMSLPETLSAKIKDAADGLKVGYSRIMRLCKCISQVLESSST